MDYKSLIDRVCEETKVESGAVVAFIEGFASMLEESLRSNDTVCIPGFGNFESKKRNERIMNHPSSPEKRLLVPPKVVVSFKPSVILKTKLNER